MTGLRDVHEGHGATFERRGERDVVLEYGRPDRAHQAVRNVVGVIEQPYDVLVVTGEDRIEYVDNVVSNSVPTEDGNGVYALLLTPQGKIRTDMYIYNAGERLLLFLPPGQGEPIGTDWRNKTFIQDVEIRDATENFTVFGVHGPKATEKIASVCTVQTPDEPLSFVRGSMVDVGVTVVRTDAPTGEEGYEVVCTSEDARAVFDTLENRGLNAAPFGYRTWQTLTLEAGTPIFEFELDGRIPNNVGLHNGIDFEKGCFVGQEVVSRIENRGNPSEQLVGLTLETVPENGATVFDGDEAAGTITRAMTTPTASVPIALALVNFESLDKVGIDAALSVRLDGSEVKATAVELPFVEGSERSARLPR